MFKTYRVPNQEGLRVSEFVADLGEIFPDRFTSSGGDNATTLYQTVLDL